MDKIIDSDYSLNLILSYMAQDYWEIVTPYLIDALEYDDVSITLEDLLADIKSGNKQLWIITKGSEIYSVLVTHIEEMYKKKRFIFRLCAGHDIEQWFYLITRFFDYAKANDCEGILVYGRRGWQKLLTKAGFQEKATIFSLEF